MKKDHAFIHWMDSNAVHMMVEHVGTTDGPTTAAITALGVKRATERRGSVSRLVRYVDYPYLSMEKVFKAMNTSHWLSRRQCGDFDIMKALVTKNGLALELLDIDDGFKRHLVTMCSSNRRAALRRRRCLKWSPVQKECLTYHPPSPVYDWGTCPQKIQELCIAAVHHNPQALEIVEQFIDRDYLKQEQSFATILTQSMQWKPWNLQASDLIGLLGNPAAANANKEAADAAAEAKAEGGNEDAQVVAAEKAYKKSLEIEMRSRDQRQRIKDELKTSYPFMLDMKRDADEYVRQINERQRDRDEE